MHLFAIFVTNYICSNIQRTDKFTEDERLKRCFFLKKSRQELLKSIRTWGIIGVYTLYRVSQYLMCSWIFVVHSIFVIGLGDR